VLGLSTLGLQVPRFPHFTEAVVKKRGLVEDTAVDAFIEAGFTRAQVLEIVVAIATKTISTRWGAS
jgi:alkylhydroperoxidase family enzyme